MLVTFHQDTTLPSNETATKQDKQTKAISGGMEAIYTSAEQQQPYLQCGMLLAIVTGQRLGDICNMKFSDVWDDMLHIEQEKTGTRLAIPFL
jgi:integrase